MIIEKLRDTNCEERGEGESERESQLDFLPD